MFGLLTRLVPPLRARVTGSIEAIRADKLGRYIDRWHTDWRPALTARIAELRAVNLPSLAEGPFADHLERVVALFADGCDIHFLLHGTNALTLADLAFTCRDLLGWDERKTFELVSGLSQTSTEPARRLAALARLAQERPAVRALLERLDEDTVTHLAEIDREFAAAFASYQDEFGCRALRYEVADPTLAEIPALTLGLLRDQLARGYDPAADAAGLERRRADAISEAREGLAGRSERDRLRFERALSRAERFYPLREENELYTFSAPLALVRYALLELSRRLTERGVIAARDDIFFLTIEEARQALRGGEDCRPLVSRRRAERAWIEAHPGP